MKTFGAKGLTIGAAILAMGAVTALAQNSQRTLDRDSAMLGEYRSYRVVGGTITVEFDLDVIDKTFGSIVGEMERLQGDQFLTTSTFDVVDSGVDIYTQGDRLIAVSGAIQTLGSFTASEIVDNQNILVGDFDLSMEDDNLYAIDRLEFGRDVFDSRVTASLDDGIFSISGPINLGTSFAEFLGNIGFAGERVGYISGQFALEVSDADIMIDEPSNQGGIAGTIGADVICGDLNQTQGQGPWEWGGTGSVAAYSFGTTSCNIGDETLLWQPSTQFHPMMPQNMYRYMDGRFEQIGLSWLKHGFCALQQPGCTAGCPGAGGCPQWLAPNCSDPYSPPRNGTQSLMGPRWQVNPFTGNFLTPIQGGTGGTLGKRIQVHTNDLNPDMNSGAIYYGEAQYVHPQDAAAGNNLNNASHRRIAVGANQGNGSWALGWSGATVRTLPAISAWPNHDPDAVVDTVDVPNEGRFYVGTAAHDNGDDTWTYEYAIYNLNSDRAARSFIVSLEAGFDEFETITNVTFKDVSYHSGDGIGGINQDGTDWTSTISTNEFRWDTATFAANQNGNALRWGTLYNFGFTSTGPPTRLGGTIGLFKPGSPTSTGFTLQAGPGVDCDDDGVPDSTQLSELTDIDANGVLDVCQALVAIVEPDGMQEIQVTVAGGVDPIALFVTGNASAAATTATTDVSCVQGYVQSIGTIGATAVFDTPAGWGSGFVVTGPELVPHASYNVQIDSGTVGNPILGVPIEVTTNLFGDVNGNGVPNLVDAQLIVQRFMETLTEDISDNALDLHPCGGNDVINLLDAQWVVKAFQGETFVTMGCDLPCGG